MIYKLLIFAFAETNGKQDDNVPTIREVSRRLFSRYNRRVTAVHDANNLSRHRRSLNHHVVFAAAIGTTVVVAALWIAHLAGESARFVDVLVIWFTHGWQPIVWLVAAAGYGRLLLVALKMPRSTHGHTIPLGIGVAVMLFLDNAAGSAGGWLPFGLTMIVMTIGGWVAFMFELFFSGKNAPAAHEISANSRDNMCWLWLLASLPIAMLLVASTSAPGWLWATEFGGYDALSYHLQLPKEWAGLGKLQPLEHNIYSFLPSFAEGAYLHLLYLNAGIAGADEVSTNLTYAYSAQLLHACITILAALATAQFVRQLFSGAVLAILAGLLVIATPWSIVVGSLAYNEMFVVLLLATAMNVVLLQTQNTQGVLASGIVLGLLIGCAIGAKLTAVGFVVLPIAVFALCSHTSHTKSKLLGIVVITSTIVLSPWLIRNVAVAGNPVFPFLSTIFGNGHWSEDQIATFASGHSFDGNLLARFPTMWNELFRQGIGRSPYPPTEPWQPQWWLLFWVGLIGCVVGLFRRQTRRSMFALSAMCFVQLVFWLFFTHLKARFMLPAIVPLVAMACGIFAGQGAIGRQLSRNATRDDPQDDVITTPNRSLTIAALIATLIFAIALTYLNIMLFLYERDGQPLARIANVGILSGNDLQPREIDVVAQTLPEVYLNHRLPDSARTLLIGNASPFYVTNNSITYQTVWDRGPLFVAMQRSDNPQHWLADLRNAGYSHIYVDAIMLEVWQRSGWLSEHLEANRVLQFLEDHATLIHTFDASGAKRLYRIIQD